MDGSRRTNLVDFPHWGMGINWLGISTCAGTYGHMLLKVDKARFNENLDSIRKGDLLSKPGWIRLSIHPTMTNKEIDFILHSIESTANNFQDWMKEYTYDPVSNEYSYRGNNAKEQARVKDWFNVSRWV